MLLGHPIDLKAKAGGERSMSEKRGPLEDAEGVVPQDPRERAKAALPEPQSPAVQKVTLAATASISQRPREPIVQLSRPATSDREGDEERLH